MGRPGGRRRARHVTVLGTGHGIHRERPESVVEAILHVLGEVRGELEDAPLRSCATPRPAACAAESVLTDPLSGPPPFNASPYVNSYQVIAVSPGGPGVGAGGAAVPGRPGPGLDIGPVRGERGAAVLVHGRDAGLQQQTRGRHPGHATNGQLAPKREDLTRLSLGFFRIPVLAVAVAPRLVHRPQRAADPALTDLACRPGPLPWHITRRRGRPRCRDRTPPETTAARRRRVRPLRGPGQLSPGATRPPMP
jgi:hypothetical protein